MWMLRTLGFVIPVFWGPRWWAPQLPRSDVPLHTVVGSPLQLPCIPKPTPEDVMKWHKAYVASVTEIFDTYKGTYGHADRRLEVV